MDAAIHPSAIVAPGAAIGAGVERRPVVHVGPDVVLADGVQLISHVVVDGHTRIGEGAMFYPFCTVGLAPQDLKYDGEPTETEIGAAHPCASTAPSTAAPSPAAASPASAPDCLLMAVVHVAHDCAIGDGVVVANNVVMGGHVRSATTR